MNTTSQLESSEKLRRLYAQAQSSIESHRTKKNKVRALSRYFKLFVIVSSALTTISLGLNFTEGSKFIDWSRNFALVFSALATAAAALMSAWDIDNYWLQRNVLITKLERIAEKMQYFIQTERALTQEELDELFVEYQSATDVHADYWKQASSSNDSNEPMQHIPKIN